MWGETEALFKHLHAKSVTERRRYADQRNTTHEYVAVNLKRITLVLQLSFNGVKSIAVINQVLQFQVLIHLVYALRVSTCSLTFLRYDPQGDAEARVLDQLNDVGVRHVDDGLAVHRQDPVSHLQLPAAVRRAALDDAANFMWHSCWRFMHSTLQVRRAQQQQIGGLRLSVLIHHSLTDWLNMSLSLTFCYSPQAYVRHPSFFFNVCGRCTDAHGRLLEMCVTDVSWEGMYNWREGMRGASRFIEPLPLLILNFDSNLDTILSWPGGLYVSKSLHMRFSTCYAV